MANSKHAAIYIETGQTVATAEALVDSGDGKTFNSANADFFSQKAGKQPILICDGIVSGRNILSVNETANTVTVANFSANSGGTTYAVSATTKTITRGVTTGYIVNSVTMTSAGVVAVVAGTEGSAFSDTRAAAGGPPLVPAGSVEIGQIRTSGTASAVITAAEIYQVPNQHTERADYPAAVVDSIGYGTKATQEAEMTAFVKFDSVLPKIHTGTIAKGVYLTYYEPTLSLLSRTVDFVPATVTASTGSTQIYGGTGGSKFIGSSSESIGAGSFTAYLENGITDELVTLSGERLLVKFMQNANKSPYCLTDGVMTLTNANPVETDVTASVTINPVDGKPTVNFAA